MRDVDHGSDVVNGDVIRVQVGVDLVGNLLWRPTPPEIVADEQRRPDKRLLVAVRPSQAGGAKLTEVCVSGGIGSRSRGATNQAGSNHRGNSQRCEPTG